MNFVKLYLELNSSFFELVPLEVESLNLLLEVLFLLMSEVLLESVLDDSF